MPLDQIDPLDDNGLLPRIYAKHFAGLSSLLTHDHHHTIVLSNMHALSSMAVYNTSGASEMIFINFFALSSRATGPKIRVPIGSFWLSMSTAELLSNRI